MLWSEEKHQVSAAGPRFFVAWGSKLTTAEAFERAALALPFEKEFADIEIVLHRARREGRTTVLTLALDRPGGVDTELCRRIAGHLNQALESVVEPYVLEVESAGLERPLLKLSDFDRFAGRDVCVRTTIAIGDAKTHRGKLLGTRGSEILLQTPAGERVVPSSAIKSANLAYDARDDFRNDKKNRKT
jgi:ribosome maturation factor RimP